MLSQRKAVQLGHASHIETLGVNFTSPGQGRSWPAQQETEQKGMANSLQSIRKSQLCRCIATCSPS